MKHTVYYASQCGAKLDCDVIRGGGSDDTAALQAVLDHAKDGEGVHLIMDGAARVTGLDLYSNTTIECMNDTCGFFLADQSNRSIVSNANWREKGERVDRCITLKGGTYNHNCQNQEHHIIHDDPEKNYMHTRGLVPDSQAVIAVEFWGVENLIMRDLTIYDQRTYAALFANWYHVDIQNVRVELPHRVHAQNQDGFHFFGPGQFLNMRNVSGRTSDDFIALAPDENDCESSITDVVIDGVTLDDADQAIRMLCHDNGRLDRVVIKNVTGTYRTYGFFMNPFFDSAKGSYGNIVIDTVDLRQNGIDYDYTPPFLFRLGGRVENLTLKNISYHNPSDKRSILDVGWQYYQDTVPITPEKETRVGSILVDGLHIYEGNGSESTDNYMRVQKSHIGNFTIRGVELVREDGRKGGTFLQLLEGADIDTLVVQDMTESGLERLVDAKEGKVGTLFAHDILAQKTAGPLVEGDGVEHTIGRDIYGADL